MIHYLLLFQFTLLYCVITVLGLVVYGSDFDTLAGKFYLIPLIAVPLIHRYVDGISRRVYTPALASAILIAGAALALWAYRPLHFAYWDEHNVTQAALLSVLGLLSYLGAALAGNRLRYWPGNHKRAATAAWLVLGLVWMLAAAYPMVPLLAIAIILAVAALWPVPVAATATLPIKRSPTILHAGAAKYLLFVLVLDLSLAIWDYQVDNRWGWHLGAAYTSAALGCWLAFSRQRQLFWPLLTVVCANFLLAILWPGMVVHMLHSALAGIGLGWMSGYLLRGDAKPDPLAMPALALPVFLGLVVGYLFYANLAFAPWRAVFLLPLAAMALMAWRRSSTATTTPRDPGAQTE